LKTKGAVSKVLACQVPFLATSVCLPGKAVGLLGKTALLFIKPSPVMLAGLAAPLCQFAAKAGTVAPLKKATVIPGDRSRGPKYQCKKIHENTLFLTRHAV
jgi:hypothetical protein